MQRHARRLYELSLAHPDFEPALEPPMSTACLRYVGSKLDEEASARLHATVSRRVEESGIFWIATTLLHGKTYFRVNPVNFRTREAHMDELFALLVKECAAALRE